MSYSIEKKKAVFTVSVPKEDTRFSVYSDRRELAIYAHQTADNNLIPYHFEWTVLAVKAVSVYNGRHMLPPEIWRLGEYADGGDIKPSGRNRSGEGYIGQWRKAAKAATPIDFSVVREIRVCDIAPRAPKLLQIFQLAPDDPMWSKWASDRPSVHAAFHALFDKEASLVKPTTSRISAYINPTTLWDALYLFMRRGQLPFATTIGD